MNASIGQEPDFEYDGMKITTVLNTKKKTIKRTVRSFTPALKPFKVYTKQQEKQNANTERRDRDLGKEQEYIDFSAADRI